MPNLLLQRCKDFLPIDATVDGADGENPCGGCRLHRGLSVSSCYSARLKDYREAGGESVFHSLSAFDLTEIEVDLIVLAFAPKKSSRPL